MTLLKTKCMSFGNGKSGILSVVVSVLAPAYKSLCRGLKFLLKERYIILVVPNVTRFLISRPFFEQIGHTALCLKKMSQKSTTSVFGSIYLHHTFTEYASNL